MANTVGLSTGYKHKNASFMNFKTRRWDQKYLPMIPGYLVNHLFFFSFQLTNAEIKQKQKIKDAPGNFAYARLQMAAEGNQRTEHNAPRQSSLSVMFYTRGYQWDKSVKRSGVGDFNFVFYA